jgi:chromosome segregation ATPase
MESGDSKQQDQVQKLIQERSAAMGPGGFDVDAISAELEKAIALQKEFEASEVKINELKQASLRVEEEARQIQRDKKSLLDEAAQILGKEGGIKITELRQEFALIQKNNEELEKKGKLTEEDRQRAKDLFNILEGYDGQLDKQNNKNKEAKKIEEEKSKLLKEQRARTQQIAKVLEKLALDEDSRSQVMAELLRFHIETEESLKRSTKEAERLTQESIKIKKEQKEVASTLASAKDSFAGKAIQAAIYYQALTTLRRVARAAVATLKELDKALTDIAVVTSMNRQQA